MFSQSSAIDESGDGDGWITAYADLISAILAVVIVLFKQYEAQVEAYVDAETQSAAPIASDQAEVPVAPVVFERDPLDLLQLEIARTADQLGISDRLVLEKDRYGLEVSLDSVALFQVGSAKLNRSSINALDPIFDLIAKRATDHRIDLSGHTDDTGSSATNWQLSALRALALLDYLQDRQLVNRNNVRLIALADTRPRVSPVGLSGIDLDNARQANRRIALRVHRLDRRAEDLN